MEERTAAPPVLGFVFAACAALTGLYGSAFWLFRDRGPPDPSYAEAAKQVREGHQPGDLILLVPHYATRMRELLGDLHPVAPHDPLGEDFAPHKNVWVVSLYGEGEALRPRFEAAGLRLEKGPAQPEGITVDRYTVTATSSVVFRFRDELKRARVFHEYEDGRKEPCDRWDELNGQSGPFGRWLCRHDPEWFYVAPEWHRMGDHQRLCLWAHPPNQGRLVIAYPGVPMTGHLYGHAGHTLNGSRYARERIDLEVRVGELAPQRFVLPLDQFWRPFALLTPEVGTATVAFAVSTPDAGANHFCFTADMRKR